MHLDPQRCQIPSKLLYEYELGIYLEEVSGPVLIADIGKGLERREERGMFPHLRTSLQILHNAFHLTIDLETLWRSVCRFRIRWDPQL